MKKLITLVLSITLSLIFVSQSKAENQFTVSGSIKDAKTAEDLIGVVVFVKEKSTGATTDINGSYSIKLPEGTYTLSVSYLGYTKIDTVVALTKNVSLNIVLKEAHVAIAEAVVSAKKENDHVTDLKMSSEKLSIETIKSIPAFMGEVDVLKSLQLLPGVQSGGEGTTGFNVRGGSADQNLVLLDDAPVYNASHLLGFFSVFNADAIKDVEIYKGGIPAAYGGRLSSLVDIKMKEGDAKKLAVEGGVGTIASRLTVEAPIVKDKGSFIVSARRTYADVFLQFSSDEALKNNRVYFYDLNAKLNYNLTEKDKLSLSGYYGQDVFKFNDDAKITWGNKTASGRWNHIFNDKFSSNVGLIYSDYNYTITSLKSTEAFKGMLEIEDLSIKTDFNYYANSKNTLRFGFNIIHHDINPGSIEQQSDQSVVNDLELDHKYALENAVYISNDQELTPKLSVQYGIRYSFLQNIGGTVYKYDSNMENVTDTIEYNSTHIHKQQGGFEPRLSLRYTIDDRSSVKVSYNKTMQYLHLISNVAGGTPLDIYMPSDEYIKPQEADQYAAGYFRNVHDNMFETSVEVYYKNMKNQVDFKDNVDLLLNNNIEQAVLTGTGKAYGAEFMIKKQKGKLTGWASYTLSRSERKIDGINNGKTYVATQDKPHSVNLVGTYQLSKRWELGATWVYASGSAVTMPSGGFEYNGIVVPVYTERNGYRLPASHRLDISVTLKGKEKPNQRYHSSWNLSLYNAYGRQNPYSIQLRQNEDDPKITEAVQTSIIGTIIPSITYNFKF
ncbi:MAG: TonB-dependent receptor [Bacteroidia bacterium]